jgi:hypothetical protein
MIRVVLVWVLLVTLEGVTSGGSADLQRQTYRGLYSNVDYGFSVEIPKGLVGVGAALHAPNHGFVITLHPQSLVSVDASYEVQDAPHVFVHYNARLGALKAEKRSWTTRENEKVPVHQSITARGFDRGSPIVYTIAADAVPEYQQDAYNAFEALVRSFRTFPVRP